MSSDSIDRLNAALSGRYVIERELGEGGMATVYLADDVKHERKVALKVLKPELAAVVGAERFLAEIKTTANLQHPHILPLFDSGEADSFVFYVMPYIEGETLRDRIDREKQLPVDDAVGIATAVANALHTAHDAGVVHRDIKPGNILLSRGEPLVADFGIALAVGGASGARMTETGLSIGTPYYMSPEQATGDQAVGPSSDTFALACVLYEMLVGEPPYPGTTAQAVLGKIIQGAPVSASAIRKSIPENVDAAIRRALEKLPADRFAGAQDFAKALGDAGFRHGEGAVASSSAHSRWNGLSVGFAAATAILAGALLWSLSAPGSSAAERVERFSLSVSPNQSPDEQITIAPDGSMMVFRALDDDGQPQLFVRRWEDLEAVPIDDTEGDLHDPVISPDGTEVAYVQNGQLKVAPIAGGLIRTLADGAVCCSRWGSDGFIYFSPAGRTISRVPSDGSGVVERITELDQAEDASHGYFQILDGGRVGVFTVWGPPRRIEAMNMETGERRRVVEGVRSWVTPTGHLVFATEDGRIMGAPFDEDAMALSGPVIPLVDGVGITSQSDAMYSVSEEGTLVYWALASGTVGRSQLVWVDRTGEASVIDPAWEIDVGVSVSWSLSPDETRVALAENTATGTDIWVKTLPDGPRSKLTFHDNIEWKPRWSPDGATITFLSDRGDVGWRVWSRRADGTGEVELLVDVPGFSGDGFWDPTGEWLILGTAGVPGGTPLRDIFAMRPSVDSLPRPLLAVEGRAEQGAAVSPNGRWLAYSSDETGQHEIFVRAFPDVDSFKEQVSTQAGVKPIWSRDGDEIFYIAGPDRASAVMTSVTVEADDGFRVLAREPLFSVPAAYWGGPGLDFYDVSADGERFLMGRTIQREIGVQTPELILVQNWFQDLIDGPGR